MTSQIYFFVEDVFRITLVLTIFYGIGGGDATWEISDEKKNVSKKSAAFFAAKRE